MKKRWLFSLLIILVISSLVLAACGTPKVEEPQDDGPVAEESDTDKADADADADEPAEPKVLTMAWTQEPDTLNRSYSNMWYMSAPYRALQLQALGCMITIMRPTHIC